MARTRAQEHPNAPNSIYAPKGPKLQGHSRVTVEDHKKIPGCEDKKRKVEDEEKQAPAPEKSKTADSTTPEDAKPKTSSVDKGKLDTLLSKYGVQPLQDTSLPKQNEATPETLLALLYLAMLSSARISHELAYKSLQCLIEANYQDVGTLKKSTWQERTEVLTKVGYTRYREKTATALGDLADFIEKEYGALCLNTDPPPHSLQPISFTSPDSDLNNLLKRQIRPPPKSGSCSRKSKALAGLARISSLTPRRASGHVWHPSLSLGVWRPPRSVVSAAMWMPFGM